MRSLVSTARALALRAAYPRRRPGESTFADGIYDVGTGPGEIPPGKYKSTNEGGNGSVFVKKSGDSYGDYATGKGQLIVTVTKADMEVEVRDATFTKM